jgi:hypothetical protein
LFAYIAESKVVSAFASAFLGVPPSRVEMSFAPTRYARDDENETKSMTRLNVQKCCCAAAGRVVCAVATPLRHGLKHLGTVVAEDRDLKGGFEARRATNLAVEAMMYV